MEIMKDTKDTDVMIIGAGAAGLMCAIEAGKRGRRVYVLEHNEKIGKKILISGGGRANFTNLYASPSQFLSSVPEFCISALTRYTAQDFITLVESHGIRYHEKKLGQLFCDTTAQEITNLLQKECDRAGVTILLNTKVETITHHTKFTIITNQGEFTCESLVIATGGLTIPKIGATDFGYRIAQQFDIHINETQPALVPLTFNPKDFQRYKDLTGISVDSEVTCNGIKFRENILFTHRGLSGPAILQISSYWNPGDEIIINLLPDLNMQELLIELKKQKVKKELKSLLSDYLPNRLVQKWCDLYFKSKPLNQYSEKEIQLIASQLHQWRIIPAGTEGYHKAEVTKGGIDPRELSSKTMESNKIKGLYFIGEVVDVTGWLGGYNFQWAWSSGWAAGQVV